MYLLSLSKQHALFCRNNFSCVDILIFTKNLHTLITSVILAKTVLYGISFISILVTRFLLYI